MASTYPSNVLQAVQWSQDNPTMQGTPRAGRGEPAVGSQREIAGRLPALLSLMGENPQWVQDLGNAFLAQPQDVMNSVQKLRAIAQQTGTLKSSPQQKVTTSKVTPPPTTSAATTTVKTTTVVEPAPTTEIIKIESTDPNVVYVPTYNPNTVYGTWPNTTYPPVYLPPTPGEQFTDSFVNGLGFSLGVPPMRCSAASTGMMTIITTMTGITAATMAAGTTISISTSITTTISTSSALTATTPAGSTTRRSATTCRTRTITWRSVSTRPTFPAA
jgi:hypothetical protein